MVGNKPISLSHVLMKCGGDLCDISERKKNG